MLSDEYANLKEEQKLAMIHESTSIYHKPTFAKVEIVLDNSDRRLPAVSSIYNPSTSLADKIALSISKISIPHTYRRSNFFVFFQIDQDTIVIARTVAKKKDQFYIDEKNVTRADVSI